MPHLGDKTSIDSEELVRLLSHPGLYDYNGWDVLWFELSNRLPFDERVYLIANNWLYSVFSSNADIGRTKNVLLGALYYWCSGDFTADSQFYPFLSELIRNGTFCSAELSLPFSSLATALNLLEKHLTPQEWFYLMFDVLRDNYFSEGQTVQLLQFVDDAADAADIDLISNEPDRKTIQSVLGKLNLLRGRTEVDKFVEKWARAASLSIDPGVQHQGLGV